MLNKLHISFFKVLVLGVLGFVLGFSNPVQGSELVEGWKVLSDAGIPNLSNKLDDIKKVDGYLKNNPTKTALQVGEDIKAMGYDTWKSLSKYDPKFSDYMKQFDNAVNNPTGKNKVWRVMRNDQPLNQAITSKNSTGLTATKTPFTIEGHVATGSRTQTPYISSFTDKSKALERAAADGGLKVVEIDLTKIDGKFFDLSVESVRNSLIKRQTTKNFAKASSEFLIVVDEIPTSAFNVIK